MSRGTANFARLRVASLSVVLGLAACASDEAEEQGLGANAGLQACFTGAKA
jgi:hypothetical protein